MAKKAILDVLESTIGKYVRDLDAESLNVAVWKGQIELHSLELDIGAINAELDRQAAESPNLALPFRVVSGSFGNFQVDVPWARISSQPVVLRANGLSVVVEPYDRASQVDHLVIDEKSDKRRIQNLRQQRLLSLKAHDEYRQRANALRKLAQDDFLQSEGSEKTSDQAGFGARLVRRIIENLQIDINDVHIVLKGGDSRAGVVLKSLSLVTTDKNGKRTFVDRTAGKKTDESSFLYKCLHMDGFGIYLDEEVTLFHKPFVQKEERQHSYILSPLSFEARLRQADSSKCYDFPKYLLRSELSQMSVLLSKTQLEFGRKIAAAMRPSPNAAHPLFPEYRPLSRISKDSARDWWVYAFRCVGRLNRRRSWAEFLRAFQKRNDYIPLYKRNTHCETCSWLTPLSKEEKATLDELEQDRSISIEGIMAWRNIADAQVEREQRKFDAARNKKRAEAGGVMASFFGTKGVPKASESQDDEPPITLTIEEMKELEAISLEQAAEAELSDDSKLYDVSFVLGSFRTNLVGYNMKQLAELGMGTVSAAFKANADGSYSFDLKLLSLGVEDRVTVKSLFPTVLRSITDEGEQNNAFALSLQKARNGDQMIKMRLVAFETVASPVLIREVKQFFLPVKEPDFTQAGNPLLRQSLSGTVDLFYDADAGPVSNLESSFTEEAAVTTEMISDKLSAAMLDAWRSKAKEKTKWMVECDIQAPIIVVPASCTSAIASVIVFNLGRLRCEYGQDDVPAKVEEWFEIQPRLEQKPVSVDPCSVRISDLALTVGKAGDMHWRKNANGGDLEGKRSAIIEPISFSLDIGIENESAVPRICAFGILPSVCLSVSTAQVSEVLTIYSAWRPILFFLGGEKKTEVVIDEKETKAGVTILEEGSGEEEAEENFSESIKTITFESARASLTQLSPSPRKAMTKRDVPSKSLTAFYAAMSLKQFSIKLLGETGDGVEAHLVSVSTSASQTSGGVLTCRLCMGWFWVVDRFTYDVPRKQRFIAHSNLPRPASAFVVDSPYDLMNDLRDLGVFDDTYTGSSELADIKLQSRARSCSRLSTDPFSEDFDDTSILVDAKLSSLFIHWNPHAVKVMTRAYSKTVASIGEAYATSPAVVEKNMSSPSRRLSYSFSPTREHRARSGSFPARESDGSSNTLSVMIVNAEMKSLEVSLDSARDDDALFTLRMADAKVKITTTQGHDQNLKTSLELGDIRIETPPTAGTEDSYDTLLGLAPNQATSLLSVHYFMGKMALDSAAFDKTDISKCGSLAIIELSPMRFVHIHARVFTLVEYVTEGILGALTAQAASSAAEAALEMAQSGGDEKFFYIKATGFDFRLPQSAVEAEHLALHTGDLIIDYRGYASPGGGVAHLTLFDVLMQDGKGQKMLNEPVKMEVQVDMSPEGVGNKEDQAMRVAINISRAAFLLSHPQYQQIMWSLERNIGEADPCLRDNSIASLVDETDVASMESESNVDGSPTVGNEMTHAGVLFVEKQNRMYIDFNVEVLSLEICGSDIVDPIAQMAAVRAAISMRLAPDENVKRIEATLHNLTSEDRRLKSLNRPFRSLIQVEDEEGGNVDAQDVFYACYTKKGENSSEVNLRLGSPRIVFIPDVIADILQFLKVDSMQGERIAYRPSESRAEKEKEETGEAKVKEGIDVSTNDVERSIETTIFTYIETRDSRDVTTMSVKLTTGECSVVLIDMGGSSGLEVDCSRSSLAFGRSSLAFLKSETQVVEVVVLKGKFDATTSFTSDALTGGLHDADVELHGVHLQIYTAHGSELLIPIQMLEPTDMSLFFSLGLKDENVKEIEVRAVTLSPVDLTVSMQNAALLNAISASFTEHFHGDDVEKVESETRVPLNERETQRINELTSALENDVEVESDGSVLVHERSFGDASSFRSTSNFPEMISVLSRIKMTFPETKLTVVNDLQGLDEALFRIAAKNFVAGLEVSQDVGRHGGDMICTTFDCHVNTSLVADYFDSSVSLWKVMLKKPWEITLRSVRGKSRRFDTDRLSTTFDLESFPCHVSFSERFLVSLAAANRMWSIYSIATSNAVARSRLRHRAEVRSKSSAASAARNLITSLPYAVENHSGTDASFAIKGDDSQQYMCPTGTMQFFRFSPPKGEGFGGQRLYGQDVTQLKGLVISIYDQKLCIDHMDAELSRPRQAHNLGGGHFIFTSVAKEGKTTVLHLSSPVDVHNHTSVPFRISAMLGEDKRNVGVCYKRDGARNGQASMDSESQGLRKPSRNFGIPIDMLEALGTKHAGTLQTRLRVLPLLPTSVDEPSIWGDIGIPPFADLISEASSSGDHYVRRLELTCKSNNEPTSNRKAESRATDPFVVQVCFRTLLVDRKYPFLQIYLEPRIVIENVMPVGVCVRTPMPHTLKSASRRHVSTKEGMNPDQEHQGQMVHNLLPKDYIEVFTPGPSIAISVKCLDHPVGGRMTTWMEGGWIDIPLSNDFRLPEPVKCVFPFVDTGEDAASSPRSEGSAFLVAEASHNLARLLLSDASATKGHGQSNENVEVLAPNQNFERRRVLLMVCNYGVDHTGDILFEKFVQQAEVRRSSKVDSSHRGRPSFVYPPMPFSAFSSKSRKRITLLPDSKTYVRLLHLTMEGVDGFRRSQPFCLENISIAEGGVESTSIRWEENTDSGYFAYRKLVDSYQFEVHVIPEFIIFNGSKNYRVLIKQHHGAEMMIEPQKIGPTRSARDIGLVISMDYLDFGGRTAQIRVDSLGYRVCVVKLLDGQLIGSVAIQTVIGDENSRLVVKLGEVKFGDSMLTHTASSEVSSGIFSNDSLRFRVRWSELQVTLNETRPADLDDDNNIAFVESAFDNLIAAASPPSAETKYRFGSPKPPSTWVDARREKSDEQEEIEMQTQRPLCTIILRRFTVDWQRIFKSGPQSAAERRNALLSPERSQLSIIIHDVHIMDNLPKSEFPIIFDSTSPSVNFLDLCVRFRGSLDAEIVKVDLFDLNLAHVDGQSEKIYLKTSEEFVWKLLDVADRMVVATAELAGVDLKLDWDEHVGGYIATATENAASVGAVTERSPTYTPPRSDKLYDINRARVSPFVVEVSFRRKPQASRYKLIKGIRGANLMNYFTTRLKFTIDRAQLRFARYDVSNVKGPPDRLIEMLVTVYKSRMKMKFVSLMSAASFQDWKYLASREGGDDEFVEGDLLRVTGNLAGSTAGYVFKKVGGGLGRGVAAVADSLGNEIENATDKVGARAVGAGVNSVVTGIGGGVGSTITGVGSGAGKVLHGAGKGVGHVFGGVTGGAVIAGKGIGKGIMSGDGKAVASGLAEGCSSVGTGVGQGVESAVMGCADGVLTLGQGLVSGVKSVGKGFAGAFKGDADCDLFSCCNHSMSSNDESNMEASNYRNLFQSAREMDQHGET